jgi:hypothetical protein
MFCVPVGLSSLLFEFLCWKDGRTLAGPELFLLNRYLVRLLRHVSILTQRPAATPIGRPGPFVGEGPIYDLFMYGLLYWRRFVSCFHRRLLDIDQAQQHETGDKEYDQRQYRHPVAAREL